MSAPMHTPGPWFVWPKDYRNRPWVVGAQEVGTRHTLAKVSNIPNCSDEVKANARLIAAAPELLEALEGLVCVLLQHSGNVATCALALDHSALTNAKAVIARVKGGDA